MKEKPSKLANHYIVKQFKNDLPTQKPKPKQKSTASMSFNLIKKSRYEQFNDDSYEQKNNCKYTQDKELNSYNSNKEIMKCKKVFKRDDSQQRLPKFSSIQEELQSSMEKTMLKDQILLNSIKPFNKQYSFEEINLKNKQKKQIINKNSQKKSQIIYGNLISKLDTFLIKGSNKKCFESSKQTPQKQQKNCFDDKKNNQLSMLQTTEQRINYLSSYSQSLQAQIIKIKNENQKIIQTYEQKLKYFEKSIHQQNIIIQKLTQNIQQMQSNQYRDKYITGKKPIARNQTITRNQPITRNKSIAKNQPNNRNLPLIQQNELIQILKQQNSILNTKINIIYQDLKQIINKYNQVLTQRNKQHQYIQLNSIQKEKSVNCTKSDEQQLFSEHQLNALKSRFGHKQQKSTNNNLIQEKTTDINRRQDKQTNNNLKQQRSTNNIIKNPSQYYENIQNQYYENIRNQYYEKKESYYPQIVIKPRLSYECKQNKNIINFYGQRPSHKE